MTLLRWGLGDDVFGQLDRMQRDMNSLMASVLPGRGYRSTAYPALNVYDDGESFIVRAEVPGIDPKSLDIEVAGETLTVKGERALPVLPEGASYHRREREAGQFCRSLRLPDRVAADKVVASCKEGILELRLPHAEEAKARRISVKG